MASTHRETMKLFTEIKAFAAIGASLIMLTTGCDSSSTFNETTQVDCYINESPREGCSSSISPTKVNGQSLLIVAWPDGDKSTIRKLNSSSEQVYINEKYLGTVEMRKGYYNFTNESTGSVIALSPSAMKLDLSNVVSGSEEKINTTVNTQKESEEAAKRQRVAALMAKYENPDYETSVKGLLGEFESNSVTAEDKYAGKVVTITGMVDSIDDTIGNNDFIGIDIVDPYDDWALENVTCFHNRSSQAVQQLKKGDRVRVTGIIDGESLGITMKGCRYSYS